MKAIFAILALAALGWSAGCSRPAGNSALASETGVSSTDPADGVQSVIADPDAPAGTDDPLNDQMSSAANVSLDIGTAQGLDDPNADPDRVAAGNSGTAP